MKQVIFALIIGVVGILSFLAGAAYTKNSVENLRKELTDQTFVTQTIKPSVESILNEDTEFTSVEEVLAYQSKLKHNRFVNDVFLQLNQKQVTDISFGIIRIKRKCTIHDIVKEYNDYKHIYNNLPQIQDYEDIKHTPPSSNPTTEQPKVPIEDPVIIQTKQKQDSICVQQLFSTRETNQRI